MKNRQKYYNPNPRKKEAGDCVVRALCKATDKDWNEVYKRLCEIGLEEKAMPNEQVCYERFLQENGFVKIKIGIEKGSRRPTVNDMAIMSENGRSYVCRVASHIVTAKDGFYWDTWESGDKCLYSYFTKYNSLK